MDNPSENAAPMKVYLSRSIPDGSIPVYDSSASSADRLLKSAKNTGQFILVFENGRRTLPIFKEHFYRQARDAHFCVQNMEIFCHQMRLFKGLEYVNLNQEDGRQDQTEQPTGHSAAEAARMESYRQFESGYRMALGATLKDSGKENAQSQNMCGGAGQEKLISHGTRMSFCPDIFGSIRTSLLCPSVYKTAELPCHRVFRALYNAGRLSYEELQSAATGDIEQALKSLVFSGIVVRKGNAFEVNDLVR